MANSFDDQGFPKRQDDFGAQNPFVSPLAVEARGHGYGDVHRYDEPLNPWVSMWTMPRETVRQQLDTDPAKHVLLVAALAGGVGQLSNALIADSPEIAYRWGVMVGAAFGGAIWSVVCLFLGAWLIGMTGRALGGVGNAAQCRTALGWSMIPTVWLFPLHLTVGLGYLYFGPAALVSDAVGVPNGAPALDPSIVPFAIIGITMLIGVVGIWQFIIVCKSIGEAHQFSAWRGLGASMLAGLAMTALAMVILIPIVIVIAVIAAGA